MRFEHVSRSRRGAGHPPDTRSRPENDQFTARCRPTEGCPCDRQTLPGSPPAAARCTVGAWVDADDEQQIDGLDHIVWTTDGNRPAAHRSSDQFGVLDGQRPAVGEVDLEGLERPLLDECTNLFDGHDFLRLRAITAVVVRVSFEILVRSRAPYHLKSRERRVGQGDSTALLVEPLPLPKLEHQQGP